MGYLQPPYFGSNDVAGSLCYCNGGIVDDITAQLADKHILKNVYSLVDHLKKINNIVCLVPLYFQIDPFLLATNLKLE